MRVVDPHIDIRQVNERATLVTDSDEELAAADLVLLVTDHDVFDLDRVAKLAPRILDTRHRIAAGTNVQFL